MRIFKSPQRTELITLWYNYTVSSRYFNSSSFLYFIYNSFLNAVHYSLFNNINILEKNTETSEINFWSNTHISVFLMNSFSLNVHSNIDPQFESVK